MTNKREEMFVMDKVNVKYLKTGILFVIIYLGGVP